MKKILLISLIVLSAIGTAWSQKNLFSEIARADVSTMSQNENRVYEIFRRDLTVRDISFIKVDLNTLREESVKISFKGFASTAVKRNTELHENGTGYSWFGRMQDETGIFFTVSNGQIASKFYLGNVPCLIVPFRGDTHLFITYDNAIDNGKCGTIASPGGVKAPGKSSQQENPPQTLSADDNCTMRVLWAVTTGAESEIPMNLELAARMLQDESNLAYQQSQVTIRMEIARVVRTTYSESNAETTITAYGRTLSAPQDLVNLRNGTGVLSSIHTMRNTYNADIVIMVRNQASGITGLGETFGAAFGVLVNPFAADPANGFAVTSSHFMIGGRFTLVHEIGHIQGGRHDNDTGFNPVYALGFVFTPSTAANTRTIMATGNVTSCGVSSSGCRIQFFSNPNLTFGGTPIGVANQRDNARRINETATQILANRITSTNLLLSAETFENEILARHLATQTISTNNAAVIAQSGSRVSMRAGTSITLKPGFHAQNGSTFSAFINTCSFVPTSSRVSTVAREADNAEESTIDGYTDSEFRVYPNPTPGLLNVSHTANTRTLSLIDMMGKTVLLKGTDGTTSSQLDLRSLPSGVYILNIDNSKKIRVMKE